MKIFIKKKVMAFSKFGFHGNEEREKEMWILIEVEAFRNQTQKTDVGISCPDGIDICYLILVS